MACAKVPSFSSYETNIHTLIKQWCSEIPNVKITQVPDNNLIIHVPGKRNSPPIALAAHLDKINHWFEDEDKPSELEVWSDEKNIWGLMDDTAGLGICLSMMFKSQQHNFPPLYLLFSEMEEGTDWRKRPHLLRDKGEILRPGIGAERITQHLMQQNIYPHAVITIDVCPKFRGEPGIALYDRFWHLTNDFTPSKALLKKTQKLVNYLHQLHPDALRGNANNDYIEYGLTFNQQQLYPVPSIALEPAIWPYHQKIEGVFHADIKKIEHILIQFLENYDFRV